MKELETSISQAADDAIQCLKERIKILRKENKMLVEKCAKARYEAEVEEKNRAIRNNRYFNASESVKKLLIGARDVLDNLRETRKLNKKLTKELDDINEELHKKINGDIRIEDYESNMFERKMYLNQLLMDYEALFKDTLLPKDIILSKKNKCFTIIEQITVSSYHSLPNKIKELVDYIYSLPLPLRDQPLDIKRKIIRTLLKINEFAMDLASKIYELELKEADSVTAKRLEAEIKMKISQYYLIKRIISGISLT